MNLDYNSILLIIIIFQFLFMGIFLFSNDRGKRLSNILLGTFCIAIAINLMDMFLMMQEKYGLVGLLSVLDLALILIMGPLIYFYCKSVVFKDYKLNRKSVIHFLPFLVMTLFVIYNFVVTPMDIQQQAMKEVNEFKLSLWQALIVVPFYIHMLIYLFLSARVVKLYDEVISAEYSDLTAINIDWLKFLFRAFLSIILISISLSIIPYTSLRALSHIVLIVFIILVFFMINKVIFKALKQPAIFSGISENQVSRKYINSNLSEEEKSDYTKAIQNLMTTSAPYLEAGLSLKKLSEMLEMKPRVISQIINEKMKMSFHDFINTQRIGHAKKLIITADSKVTFLEILYQSGFNSKSSFNTAFKKVTGLTPKEFRKNLEKN